MYGRADPGKSIKPRKTGLTLASDEVKSLKTKEERERRSFLQKLTDFVFQTEDEKQCLHHAD